MIFTPITLIYSSHI